MCMEDIRIARATRTKTYDLTINVGAVQVLAYNPKRFSLVFTNASASTIYIGTDSGIQAGRGFAVTGTTNPVFIRLTLEGDLVRQAIWMNSTSANNRITVYETELADE